MRFCCCSASNKELCLGNHFHPAEEETTEWFPLFHTVWKSSEKGGLFREMVSGGFLLFFPRWVSLQNKTKIMDLNTLKHTSRQTCTHRHRYTHTNTYHFLIFVFKDNLSENSTQEPNKQDGNSTHQQIWLSRCGVATWDCLDQRLPSSVPSDQTPTLYHLVQRNRLCHETFSPVNVKMIQNDTSTGVWLVAGERTP